MLGLEQQDDLRHQIWSAVRAPNRPPHTTRRRPRPAVQRPRTGARPPSAAVQAPRHREGALRRSHTGSTPTGATALARHKSLRALPVSVQADRCESMLICGPCRVVDFADGTYQRARCRGGTQARSGPGSSVVGERTSRQVDRTCHLVRQRRRVCSALSHASRPRSVPLGSSDG